MKNLEKFLNEQLDDPVFVRSYINELKKELNTSRDKILEYQKQMEKEQTEKERILTRMETMQRELDALKNAESDDPFYSESNIHYLENIVDDIKHQKAHFAEHDLFDDNHPNEHTITHNK